VKKSDLRAAIIDQLRRELDLQIKAAHLARDEAISEESRAENKYDTHSQEAAYLAEGQARLAAEIETNLALYSGLNVPDFSASDPIALGALVDVEAAGKAASYFLGPKAGGLELKVGGHDILLLTPQSPLGRQLIGKRVGDVLAGGQRIIGVS
jgi:transcription elongation GreA/GreB family factor